MADLIRQSNSIIREAGASLADQRGGGRRRKSIGRASAKMKAGHLLRKLRNLFIGQLAILIGASIAGSLMNGLGTMGVLAVAALAVVAGIMLLRYPALKVPTRASLNTPDVRQLVGRTELWLESQRSALPPPAAKLVSGIGVRLDELEMLLVEVDQKHPTALQIHKLVGEDLPEMIEGFQRIPERMRYEERGGTTPARQLEDGLAVIGREIESINRQLAEGSLDDLAIRTRYLDYKYGDADNLPSPELPSPAKDA